MTQVQSELDLFVISRAAEEDPDAENDIDEKKDKDDEDGDDPFVDGDDSKDDDLGDGRADY